MSPELRKGRFAVQDAPIRIQLPAHVGNDLDTLKTTIGELVGRLGCGTCFSGIDCRFLREKNFVVDPAGHLADPQPSPWAVAPDPQPWRSVTVSVAPGVANNIEGVQEAIGRVVDRLGCGSCCSGFDIEFRHELDLIRIDEELNVSGFGQFA